MPVVLRRSGPSFERNGETIEPRAMIARCDGCGAENAAFLVQAGGKWQAWCGWRDGNPGCVAGDRETGDNPESLGVPA